ncbi:MAG TPA: hypothetical protein VJL87_03620, partial [Bdellovibrionota bacterium]|nr:hypothetical protein [Bdellovibrionota bacterium]
MLRKVSLTFLISFFLITPAIADELSSVDEFYQKCKENEIYGAQRLFDVDEAAQIDLPTLTEIINGLATIRGQYLHNPSNAEQSPPKGFKYWSANIHDGYSTVSFDTKKVRLFFSVAFQGVVTPKIFILRAFDSRDKHIELSSERFSVDHSLSAKRGRFWEDPFVEELSRPTQSPTKTNIVPIPLQQQLTGDELAAKLIQSLDYVETLSTINRLLYQYRGFPDDLLIDLPRKYDLWIGRGVRPTHKTVKGNIRANAERLKQILLKKGRPIPPLLEFLSALRLYGEFNSNRPLLPQIIKDQIVPDLNLGKTIWGI